MKKSCFDCEHRKCPMHRVMEDAISHFREDYFSNYDGAMIRTETSVVMASRCKKFKKAGN